MGEERLGALAVLAVIELLEARELIHVAGSGLEQAGGLAEMVGPMAACGNGAEHIGLRLAFAGDFILRGAKSSLRGGQRGAVGIDLRAHGARQVVQAGEEHDDDENRKDDGKKSKSGSSHG